jgi:succinate dehydrogenase hydrophobic anchor subunit
LRKILYSLLIFVPIFSAKISCAAVNYDFEIPFLAGQKSVTSLSQYVKMIFVYGLSMVGVVALFAFVYSGFRYLISGSSDTRRQESKKGMWAAFSGIVLLLFSFAILYTINPQLVSLQEPNADRISVGSPTNTGSSNNPYVLEMPLPGAGQTAPNDLGGYIRNLFLAGLALVGFAALFGISYGAFVYFTSGGNESMKTHGRKWITSALSGLTLLLLSFAILYTINPQLTTLRLDQLTQVNVGGAQNSISSSGSYQLEMPLGTRSSLTDISSYIKNAFLFGLGLVGVTALFGLSYGGIVYLLSAGSSPMQTHAKTWIWSAISGLTLLICSFAILYTINPQLTTLRLDQLNQINIGSRAPTNYNNSTGVYNLEMPLGAKSARAPNEYVRLIFIYGLGIVGAAALFGLVYGGLNYVLSAGSESRKTEGKQWALGAVSGLSLLLCSFLILYTINPQLISFQNPQLETIQIQPHAGIAFSDQQISQVMGQIRTDYDNIISQHAANYPNISPDLVRAILMAESGGNPNAVSSRGAQGVMQFMPSTASMYGINPNDPSQAIPGAFRMLNDLNRLYNGNIPMMLSGWNWGSGNFKNAGNDINKIPAKTQIFINNVRRYGGF